MQLLWKFRFCINAVLARHRHPPLTIYKKSCLRGFQSLPCPVCQLAPYVVMQLCMFVMHPALPPAAPYHTLAWIPQRSSSTMVCNGRYLKRLAFVFIVAYMQGQYISVIIIVPDNVDGLVCRLHTYSTVCLGSTNNFFLFSFFMPDLACCWKVWVRAFYSPKMSL